uniref:Uncharacterized protein n=1 Tax=Zea mays TaxID=4577 RepID=A0A804PQH7_MAIZE
MTRDAGAEGRAHHVSAAAAAVSVLFCSSCRSVRRLFFIPSLAADPNSRSSVRLRYDSVFACWGYNQFGGWLLF